MFCLVSVNQMLKLRENRVDFVPFLSLFLRLFFAIYRAFCARMSEKWLILFAFSLVF